MNVQRLCVIVALLGLGLAAFRVGAADAPGIVPPKGPLTIPVKLPAPRSVECVVPFGPPVARTAVAFSPDGKRLAAAGYQEVLIWDLENAQLLKRIGTGQLGTRVGALAFLPGSGLLAVGEGTPYGPAAVRIFDVESGQQTQVFEEPREVVRSLGLSPDGKLLAAGGAEPVARVWNLEEKKLVATISGHTDWVLGVAFSRDGKLLATAGADNTVGIWEVGTWNSVSKVPESEPVRGVAFAANAVQLAVAVGGPHKWGVHLRRRDNLRYNRSLSTGPGRPSGLIWSKPKNRIYVPCSDNTVRVFDANGRLLASLAGHDDWVYSVAVNQDESRVASGSADGTVKLWNTQDNRLLATLIQLSPQSDEWLITTPEGYLAASSMEALQWKTANVKTPPDQLAGLLGKPDQVRASIAGTKVPPPAVE